MIKWILLMLLLATTKNSCAQVESGTLPLKLKHAEPLYMDLIRDLGAHKGEKEINIGLSYGMNGRYKEMGGFAEFEFAVANRWGMEVETDFSFYKGNHSDPLANVPSNRIEGLKWANQYTFLVSEDWQTSMAFAFIHEFRFHSFYSIRHRHQLMKGVSENPILIIARRWGKHVHSLLYTGPEWMFSSSKRDNYIGYQLHTSIHYVWDGGYFLGIECNQEKDVAGWHSVLHPQLKLALNDAVSVGLVIGVPLRNTTERAGFMTRLILEL